MKQFVAMLVNGTKEKNPSVKSSRYLLQFFGIFVILDYDLIWSKFKTTHALFLLCQIILSPYLDFQKLFFNQILKITTYLSLAKSLRYLLDVK